MRKNQRLAEASPLPGLRRVKLTVEYEADVWVDDTHAYLSTDAQTVVIRAMRSASHLGGLSRAGEAKVIHAGWVG